MTDTPEDQPPAPQAKRIRLKIDGARPDHRHPLDKIIDECQGDAAEGRAAKRREELQRRQRLVGHGHIFPAR